VAKLVIALCAVVALDQLSKYLVQDLMSLYTSIPLLGEVVKLTYIRNPGAAFGINLGNKALFIILSIVACGVMGYYFTRLPAAEHWGRFALTLIFGGAIGNLIDRIQHGEVTDFIDVGLGSYRWPIFNVADMAVTIGVILLFIRLSSTHPSAAHASGSEQQRGFIHREDRPA
jgi:signal peptidase II